MLHHALGFAQSVLDSGGTVAKQIRMLSQDAINDHIGVGTEAHGLVNFRKLLGSDIVMILNKLSCSITGSSGGLGYRQPGGLENLLISGDSRASEDDLPAVPPHRRRFRMKTSRRHAVRGAFRLAETRKRSTQVQFLRS